MNVTKIDQLTSFLRGAHIITNYHDRSSTANTQTHHSEVTNIITGLPTTTQIPTADNTHFMDPNTGANTTVYNYF